MKTILILMLCIYGLKASSQAYLMPSVGITKQGRFIAGMGLKYEIGIFNVTGEMIDVVNVKDAMNFGGNIGITVLRIGQMQIIPAAGYYYHYFSSDKNEYTIGKNYWLPMYSIKLQLPVLFLQFNYLDNFSVMIGTKIKL